MNNGATFKGEHLIQYSQRDYNVTRYRRAPLLRPDYMKSNITSILTDIIFSSFQSASRYLLGQNKVDLKLPEPKFPPELERQIFETCALDSPEVCTNLVLVSKRVYEWSVNVLILLFWVPESFQD